MKADMNGTPGFDLAIDDYEGTDTIPGETSDPLLKKIKKNHTEFFVWRIEKYEAILVPKDQSHIFYDSECYLIYAASEYGKPSGPTTISREVKTGVEQHIHFWLGKNATNEIVYTAAYKCVELDKNAGGNTTQHREVQGEESNRFKGYFNKTGFKILCGKYQANNKQISDLNSKPRLYRVSGIRSPFITQQPNVSWGQFTSSYVMLLQTLNNVYVWVGRVAGYNDKRNGAIAALQLKEEYDCSQVIFLDDGYEKTMNEKELKEFDSFLPLHKRVVSHIDEEIDDETQEYPKSQIKLYHCSESTGKYRVTEVKSGPLKQSDLCSDDVFIIDHGLFGIWVWVGKRANEKERVEAIRNARGFVKKKNYPNYVQVTRVVDEYEPYEFKALFSGWKEKLEAVKFIKGMLKPVPTVKVTKYDSVTLHERPELAARSQLLDDGSGTIQKFMFHQDTLKEIPKERNSVFFSGDCYVIKYTYKTPIGEKSVLYYWMGLHSVTYSQNKSFDDSVQLDYNLNKEETPHIVRLIQGRESPHFLQIFKGKMRTFMGESSNYDPSLKNLKTPSHYLLQVEGSASYNSKAYQVKLKAQSLNTNYCFVLRKSSHYFVWCGSNSTGDNREMAKAFAGNDFALILEGNESPEFWHAITGKTEYTTKKLIREEVSNLPPRLFQLSVYGNNSKFKEIIHYTQEDLHPESMMMLDAQSTIILWIGVECGVQKQMITDIVSSYLLDDPIERDKHISVQLVKQNLEPPTFTGFFENWDRMFWMQHKTYADLREQIGNESTSSRTRFMGEKIFDEFDQYPKYPIHILTGPSDKLPSPVDPLRRELHLTYDDFITLTHMTYNDFKTLPSWKQQDIKKKVGLF